MSMTETVFQPRIVERMKYLFDFAFLMVITGIAAWIWAKAWNEYRRRKSIR